MMKLKELLGNWEVFIILIVMLFLHGAFFSEDFIGIGIGGGVVILLTVLYRLITKTGTVQLNWLTLVCWGVAFSYGITLWTTVTVEGSLLKMVEWFTYGLLLLFVRSDYAQQAHVVLRLFTVVFCLVHVGLLVGFLPSVTGFFNVQQELSASGLRLNGLLQYANATGAIAAALLLYTLYAQIEKRSWKYVDMVLLTTLAYILWLTESRGALLVLGVSFLIGLFVTKQQMQYLILFAASMLTGLMAYIVALLINGPFGHFLAIALVVVGALTMEKLKSKWDKPLAKWFIPLSLITGIGSFLVVTQTNLLPQSVMNRLTFTTLQARFVYMQDALQALKEFWLFGAGGDAWKFVVYQYQSTGYVANDIHMFWEQHWLETGLIGIVLLAGACVIGFVIVAKQTRALLPILVMLLVHSCIDFTLSYGLAIFLVLLLFFEGLQERAFITRQVNWASVPVLVVACCVLSGTIIWQQAENSFQQYAATADSRYLQQALDKNPYATRFYEAKAAIAEQPVEQFEHILKYEPRHAKYWFYAAQSYYKQGKYEQALNYFEKALTYDRFDWTKYELADQMLQAIGTTEALALNEQLIAQKRAMKKMAATSKLKNQERENLLKNNEGF